MMTSSHKQSREHETDIGLRWVHTSSPRALGPNKSAKPPQEQFPTPQVGNKGEPGSAVQLPESPHVEHLQERIG